MPQPPTGTVTFLFTDIEGSTRLWERQPDAMGPALARHDALLAAAIADSGGHVFKTVGDAFCAAFATAPDALDAALAAQLALSRERWATETPLRVRMALHTGAAEERDGDYFGPPLNRVARLLSAGHGGQTLLSRPAQELVRDALPAGAGLRDLGERRLKDLSRPEHVSQLQHPDLPDDFPPLRSLDNPDLPNNLPQQVTSFVGRERETARVKALLAGTRLLTLAGAGGAGKSRLSLQVAADLLDQYFDGVWLVELAPLSDPALVPQSVAEVLGVREQAGEPLTRLLTDALKPKRLLLILDNCEHLIAACARLAADLLRSCPQVQILASSREPLNVSGETVYRIPSLSLPDPKRPQTVGSVSQYEAVRLFIERAQAARPGFTVTDANAPAVAQVCWHLDGIPLALELAAARVRSLSVEEVNARLDQRFRLLTGGSRTLLPRQQTLRALIDWSHDLLTDAERVLLRRLSVFAGGWTLASAETVCSDEGLIDLDVLDLLTGLVDKSLVVAEARGDGTRYGLQETLRQYADDRLQQAGEKEDLRGRHRDGFFAMAREAEPQLERPDLGVWLGRLGTELDNLRAALDCGLARAAQDPSLAVRVIQTVAALRALWQSRALSREGHAYAAAALAVNAAARAGDEAKEQMSVLALLHSYDGDQAAACRLMDERLAWCRSRRDALGVIHTLFNSATVRLRMGETEQAQRLNEECLAEIGRASASDGVGEDTLRRYRVGVEGNLAVAAWDAGDYGRAHALIAKNIPVFRDQRNTDWLALSLLNVGALLLKPWEGRDLVQARRHLREGLSLSALNGHRLEMLDGVAYVASLAAAQEDWARAARLFGAADGIREEMGLALSPAEEEETAALLTTLRAALEPQGFAAAWDAGRAMTLEEAAEFALGGDEG